MASDPKASGEYGRSKDTESRRIYVASSWKNEAQPSVVTALRDAGHEVYDFRQPTPGDNGFHWSDVADGRPYEDWSFEDFRTAVSHPIARAGFRSDFDAMKWADTCVLLLPCGRSAHLELGWFVGQGRKTVILKDPLEGEPFHHFGVSSGPELMYRMVDLMATSVRQVVEFLTPCPGCRSDGCGLVSPSHQSICVRNPYGDYEAFVK